MSHPWVYGDDGLPEGWPADYGIPTLGLDLLAWSETELIQPDGDYAGSPWQWTTPQGRYIMWWYSLTDEGQYLFRRGQIVLPKGPLAHNTPVPTPQGWKRHGDLVVGDEVYASNGDITTVEELHPVVLEACYRVTFKGGESVVCTGSHRWPVMEFNGGGRTYKELSVNDMLRRSTNSDVIDFTPIGTDRTISSIERTTTVPCRCIRVSHPSHQYLVTHDFIPTCNSGKSPMAAALACCELAGPTYFDGWDASGNPVGRRRPSPLVQLAAVSQDQTDNTMSLAIAMMGPDSPAYQHIRGLDSGLTRIRTANGLLLPVTSSSATREGQRTTAAIMDETHLWVPSNGGKRLAATIRRNLAKMNGRAVETTNTWEPGTESVAEATWDNANKLANGTAKSAYGKDAGILRWHPMPKNFKEEDLANRDKTRKALGDLYKDSPWIDIDRTMEEIFDLNQDPRESLRFYLNIVTSASAAWITEPEWQACKDDKEKLEKGDIITLGFDGSRGKARGKPDATALVACRVSDGFVTPIDVWEAPERKAEWAKWEPPLTLIESAIDHCFKEYNVVGMYADPAKDWRSYVDAWEAKHGLNIPVKSSSSHPFEWWMVGGRSGIVERAVEQVEGAIRNQDLHHNGDYRLTGHLLNCYRRITHGKLALGKADDYSSKKIDAAVAMVLAWQCRLDALAKGVGIPKVTFVPTRIR